MLNRLFGKRPLKRAETGIYKVENGVLVELEDSPGNGSINSIIEYLGYDISQVHTVITFDSLLIDTIGVKIFTQEPVFVFAKDKKKKVSFKNVAKELRTIDWGFEYSSHTIEEILNDGIERESLTVDFLSSCLSLKNDGDNLYNAPEIGLYLKFEKGKLIGFASSDWSTSASKWLKSINKKMFHGMFTEAMRYHRNEIEAMEEVNLQCEALMGIPNAMENEFLNLHKKANGNFNFFNLLAVHYNLFNGERIKIDDFKTVNEGRFKVIGYNKFKTDLFVFQFDSNGHLLESKQF